MTRAVGRRFTTLACLCCDRCAISAAMSSSSSSRSSRSPAAASNDDSVAGYPASVLSALPADVAERLRSNPARGMHPGQVWSEDYRSEAEQRQNAVDAHGDDPFASRRPLKLLQWNIERGYRLAEIVALLRHQNADILSLQEVDIGCARSGWEDCARVIARELRMNLSFLTEFDEIYCASRKHRDQGGGVHGNAILSRYPHVRARVVEHPGTAFDWNNDGHTKNEPRRGCRSTLVVDVAAPAGVLAVYSTHLEVFAGIEGRLRDFADIMRDSKDQRHVDYRAILGDFNTLAHGIARFSPSYCTDSLRFGSIGWTESEWWLRHVLHRNEGPEILPAHLRLLGVPERESLRNSQGYYDPFDAYADVTLVNYRNWFQGKLDWMLLSNLTHHSTLTANDDYKASDHKLMACTVTFDAPLDGSASTSSDRAPSRARRNRSGSVSPLDSAAASSSRFAPKTSADLRALMPLRRGRPGCITTSSRDLSWIVILLLVIALFGARSMSKLCA